MESEQWWALVKFSSRYGLNNTDEIAVSKIQIEYKSKKGRTKRKAFRPSNLTDFETHEWYVVWTSEGSTQEGTDHPYYGLIGRLSETREGLHAVGLPRISWPRVQEMEDEPDTNIDEPAEVPSCAIKGHQESRRKNKNSKEKALTQNLEDYMSHTQLQNGDDHDGLENEEEESVSNVRALKAKIRKLESEKDQQQMTELSSLSKFVEEQITTVHELLRTIVASVNSLRGETDRLKVNVQSQSDGLNAVQTTLSDVHALIGESSQKAIEIRKWLNSLPDK